MKLQKQLNLIFIYVLSLVLIGGYAYQIFSHEEPCILCFMQRLGMTGVSIAILMNLRFGIRVEHYGLAILAATVGRVVSLRQIGMHICPQFAPFGHPILGLELYVWSYIVFGCSVFACAVLLIMYGLTENKKEQIQWGGVEKFALALVALVAFGNFVNALFDCSLFSCP
ncbi:MAG: disulfide bond formation protein B [Chlamydiae bacterium CG10_big_fil_rev_8_21_14_0_10_42_34]|nr:MAG: disulfide bond formation protein B [Chlamydiae bacterium CG10_big_fil_rev_8_21_14_0_10_42_34]